MARRITRKRFEAGLRVIFDFLRPHKKEVLILISLSIIEALGNASVPYLSGKIIDSIHQEISLSFFSYKIPLFLVIPVFWFLIKIITDIVAWRGNAINETLNGELEAEYIISGFSKIMEFPISVHKSQKSGEITNRIARASGMISSIVSEVIIRLAPQFLSILAALFFTFLIRPLLAFILLGAVILYAIALTRIAPRLADLSSSMNKAYTKAWGDAHDAILNVQAVKQATAEEHEKKKLYKNYYEKAARFWTKYITLSQSINFSQKVIVSLTQLTIFIVSIFLIRSGQMTIGELVAFNGYAALLFGPFVILAQNWRTIQNGLITIERAEKILRIPPEDYSVTGKIRLDIKGEISFRNVSFAYKKTHHSILKDINFDVNTGEIIALVGESGVGKSTLVDLISRYFSPTKGKIKIDGVELKNIDLKTLRRQIAVVPQEVILFHDTIKNNIRYGNFSATNGAVKKAASEAYANEFIEKFEKKYDQVVGERGIKLSVGQKQRLAIARAILKNPRILILDEPTSALDAISEKLVTEALEKLMTGRTTFIIAHRLSTVRKANNILVLKDGEIQETGRHDELVKIPDGIYRRLYEYQIGLK